MTSPVPLCGERAQVKERPVVHYVDLPVYGTAMSLSWKKHRLRCVEPDVPQKVLGARGSPDRGQELLVDHQGSQVGDGPSRGGRTVSEVAAELSCDWHTVNEAVITYGEALLAADRKRLNRTTAIGLDETSFVKLCSRVTTDYATTVADVENHQIIEILPTRKYTDVAGWIDKQPEPWKERIRFGALDMSATYAAVYSVMLPKAAQVVDPFHVISLANRSLDAVRRRVQTEQTGHRGRRDDPLYRVRRVLLRGEEHLDAGATERLWSLLALGDPGAEVAIAYRVKERLRDFYRTRDPDRGQGHPQRARAALPARTMPPEIQRLGRTLQDWFEKIANFHLARVSNGPTEALNNLIKRIKRIGFGFRNFENYRIRALLYAGKPNWRVLGSIVVR